MNNEVVAHRFIYGETTSAKGSHFSFEYIGYIHMIQF